MSKAILDQFGKPLSSPRERVAELHMLRRQLVRAKYDAAQTNVHNENHWANSDNLDPHSAASYTVRKKLRSRSRYEVLENNPYLKGTILTIANDFVGSGPKLRITDKRLTKERKKIVEQRWRVYTKKIGLRQKLWRMRLAKIVDGESFGIFHINDKLRHPVQVDYAIIEADQVSSQAAFPFVPTTQQNEIDGVRFDRWNNPTEYFVLNSHPGSTPLTTSLGFRAEGRWIDEKFILHWFRKDRGWLRGIPETTPSLPHCSILRRYTLALVRHAETAADFSAVLETDGPAGQTAWTDGSGNAVVDDPFDTFPLEHGSIMNLPWGYKLNQLNAVPIGEQYDEFVGATLREITRPLLVPYNIAAGTSKDSNMATSIVDQHIYKGAQRFERMDCEENILETIAFNWWNIGIRTEAYFDDPISGDAGISIQFPTLLAELPEHEWGWDNIGLDHTDPSKVAAGIETLHNGRHMTDRDIQETFYNRDVEDWRKEVLEDDEFRKDLTPFNETESEEPSLSQEDENA